MYHTGRRGIQGVGLKDKEVSVAGVDAHRLPGHDHAGGDHAELEIAPQVDHPAVVKPPHPSWDRVQRGAAVFLPVSHPSRVGGGTPRLQIAGNCHVVKGSVGRMVQGLQAGLSRALNVVALHS